MGDDAMLPLGIKIICVFIPKVGRTFHRTYLYACRY